VGLLYSFFRTNISGQRATMQLFEVSGQQFRHLAGLPMTAINYKQLSFVVVSDLAEHPAEVLP
jgi:hypothetical protein